MYLTRYLTYSSTVGKVFLDIEATYLPTYPPTLQRTDSQVEIRSLITQLEQGFEGLHFQFH